MSDTRYFKCEWCLRPMAIERNAGSPQKYCCKEHRNLMAALNKARREAGRD
jgi:hypothetical protein